MGIKTIIKRVKAVANTVAAVKDITFEGGAVVNEISKGIKGSKAANRMDELESFAFELIFEKLNSPYIDGARIYDSTKQVNLSVSAFYIRKLRHLIVTDTYSNNPIFTISEKGHNYNWRGEPEFTRFMLSADGIKDNELELQFGGTFWKYNLPKTGLQATETSTGYRVVNSNKEVVAETVGKLRSEDNALIYVKDSKGFNTSLGLLFSPVFFQAVLAPDNFSETHKK